MSYQEWHNERRVHAGLAKGIKSRVSFRVTDGGSCASANARGWLVVGRQNHAGVSIPAMGFALDRKPIVCERK